MKSKDCKAFWGIAVLGLSTFAHGQSFFDPIGSDVHLDAVEVTGLGTFDLTLKFDAASGMIELTSADPTTDSPNPLVSFDSNTNVLETRELAVGTDTYWVDWALTSSEPTVQFQPTAFVKTAHLDLHGDWMIDYSNSFADDSVTFNTNGSGSLATFGGSWSSTGMEEQFFLNLGLSNLRVSAVLGDDGWFSGTFDHFNEQGTFVGTPVSGGTSLGLNNNRFNVSVDWNDGQQSGMGNAVQLTDDSGGFFFFDANNVDLLVRVLDGCSDFNNFWVFAGATTDVEFDLTVTDSVTNESRSYSNSLGEAFAPVTDTSAFATCP